MAGMEPMLDDIQAQKGSLRFRFRLIAVIWASAFVRRGVRGRSILK
jgi:hypothetical protein